MEMNELTVTVYTQRGNRDESYHQTLGLAGVSGGQSPHLLATKHCHYFHPISNHQIKWKICPFVWVPLPMHSSFPHLRPLTFIDWIKCHSTTMIEKCSNAGMVVSYNNKHQVCDRVSRVVVAWLQRAPLLLLFLLCFQLEGNSKSRSLSLSLLTLTSIRRS